MLTDKELQDLTGQFESFKVDKAEHEKKIEDILGKYESILSDYRRLKSDYEEEREAREKYKRIAKDGDRNPFVLVLVDGDGYVVSRLLAISILDLHP
jgi:chromosome segregation ATPase